LQKAWQSQDAGGKVLIDADAVVEEVRRNQRQFQATIFWRDAREVGVSAFMTWLFLHWAIRDRQWALYLVALACFGVGAFMVVDRLIQRRKQPALNDSLKACIESSLFHVNHQIWLLRNVFWWYLLPLVTGLVIFTGVSVWNSRRNAAVMAGGCAYVLTVILLYWGIYRLNQRAVLKSLEPLHQELETLLASLE
jgi:hypothetical protein